MVEGDWGERVYVYHGYILVFYFIHIWSNLLLGQQQWARFQRKPNQTIKPWFNGLLVPKKLTVWFGFSINGSISVRFGSKTWVYRFTIEVENSVNKLLTELSTSLVGNRFKYWYFKSFDMKTVNPYPYVLMIFLLIFYLI